MYTFICLTSELRAPQRFAEAERSSRGSQRFLNPRCNWVCDTEHAPRDPIRLLERRHGLADIGSIEFAASCANTAMVQVCAEKYYPYVECLYEAAAIHASDGDLVCVELDCAAALGAATSDAVAARPAALVAVTCAALVLYWAAVPIAR